MSAKHEVTSATKQTVRDLSSFNCTQHQISMKLGIDEKTLRKYYKEELVLGTVDIIKCAGNTIKKKAMNGDFEASKFILKSRAKWGVVSEDEADVSVVKSIAETHKDVIDKKTKESISE